MTENDTSTGGNEPPSCPNCGANWVRSGPYFNILGELKDMRVTEATAKYYQNREQYREDTVQVFDCGNKVVVNDSKDHSVDTDTER